MNSSYLFIDIIMALGGTLYFLYHQTFNMKKMFLSYIHAATVSIFYKGIQGDKQYCEKIKSVIFLRQR